MDPRVLKYSLENNLYEEFQFDFEVKDVFNLPNNKLLVQSDQFLRIYDSISMKLICEVDEIDQWDIASMADLRISIAEPYIYFVNNENYIIQTDLNLEHVKITIVNSREHVNLIEVFKVQNILWALAVHDEKEYFLLKFTPQLLFQKSYCLSYKYELSAISASIVGNVIGIFSNMSPEEGLNRFLREPSLTEKFSYKLPDSADPFDPNLNVTYIKASFLKIESDEPKFIVNYLFKDSYENQFVFENKFYFSVINKSDKKVEQIIYCFDSDGAYNDRFVIKLPDNQYAFGRVIECNNKLFVIKKQN
jgi:hypothetical protein